MIGAFVAGSLAPQRVGRSGTRPWVPAAPALAGFAGVLAFCLPMHPPAGATGTVVLDRAAVGPRASANATITIAPAGLAAHADFVQQLSWQGHTKSIERTLRPIAPGVHRTDVPLPLYGTWKSLSRLQNGGIAGDVPVYLPADPAIPVTGIPALRSFTRAFIIDQRLSSASARPTSRAGCGTQRRASCW